MVGRGSVCAIGRLTPGGPWVGIESGPDDYRLVFGMADGSVHPDGAANTADRRTGVVAAAIAYFLAVLTDPPPELEATHADVAAAIRSMVAGTYGRTRLAAQDAVDAIDDGIHADSVALRLQRLLPPGADAIAILRDRLEALPAAPD